jgi:hypothetical protein
MIRGTKLQIHTFIQKWCSWLCHWNLNSSAVSQSAILPSSLARLPIELPLSITAFLLLESVIALRLASKGFIHLVLTARSQLRGDPLVKQRFLLLLENDVPDHLLCHTYNRLYNWRTSQCWYPPTDILVQPGVVIPLPTRLLHAYPVATSSLAFSRQSVSRAFCEKLAISFSEPTRRALTMAFLFLTLLMNA